MTPIQIRKPNFPKWGLFLQLLGISTLIAALFVKNPLFLTLAFPVGILFLVTGFIAWIIYIVANDKMVV